MRNLINKKPLYLLLSILMICQQLPATSATGAELSVDEVILYIKDKSANLRSYKADFVMKMIAEEGEVTSIGSLIFKKPDKMRMEMDLAGPVRESQVMISDERYRWQYIPAKGVAFKVDMGRLRELDYRYADEAAQDISNPLDGIKEDAVVYKGQGEINDEAVFIIEGPLVEIDRPGIEVAGAHKAEIYIGALDGIARKYTIYDEAGDVVVEQVFSNIQKNIDVEDSEFEFSPPDGVDVIDSTDDIINSLAMADEREPEESEESEESEELEELEE